MNKDRLAIEVNEEAFPWIKGRKSSKTKPKYKIIARSMSRTQNSIVMLHIAGTGYVKNYYIREVLQDKSITSRMAQEEVELLRWVICSEDVDPLEDIKSGRQEVEA